MKIAVLFGGDSMERDVSIASASQVVGALRSRGHQVIAYDSGRGRLTAADEQRLVRGQDRSPAARQERAVSSLPTVVSAPDLADVDLVFLAMHGGSGEDGTVQALLDLGRHSVHGLAASSAARSAGTRTSRSGCSSRPACRQPDWLMAPVSAALAAQRLGFPLIVKPNGQGSTVGLTLVEHTARARRRARARARLRFASHARALHRRAASSRSASSTTSRSPSARSFPTTGPIFDYAAKYQAGGAEEIFPAELDAPSKRRARRISRCACIGR